MATVLYLNPYHGGSHQAFLEGWRSESRHQFEVLTLPPYKWKWRMRHAAVTFAQQLTRRAAPQDVWDVLFCTDMLNLAEFRGLCCSSIAGLPSVVYFHENQLTYPNQHAGERDLHFAFTNMTSALSASRVWFNSAFHRREFLDALQDLLRRMPDYQSLDVLPQIHAKSEIHPPGVPVSPARDSRRLGPLRILWAGRWEHDKAPQTFFEALRRLRVEGSQFRLTVLGQAFGECPECFQEAEKEFQEQIVQWGYLPERSDYQQALVENDVVVSTAKHEFFGIAVLEAVAAGCLPLVPRRLAYPEVLGERSEYFYDGSAAGLAARLAELCGRVASGADLFEDRRPLEQLSRRYGWSKMAARMDDALSEIARS